MRQQPRLWDSYPEKSPNLRHHQAHSQNKGLSRASRLRTSTSPARDRQAGATRTSRGQSRPQRGILSKLKASFIANQDFLQFWTVDICQKGGSLRSAHQRRQMAHLRWHSLCEPRKPSGWDRGGDNMHFPTWGVCTCQAPGCLSCSDLGRAQNSGPTKSVPLWST